MTIIAAIVLAAILQLLAVEKIEPMGVTESDLTESLCMLRRVDSVPNQITRTREREREGRKGKKDMGIERVKGH